MSDPSPPELPPTVGFASPQRQGSNSPPVFASDSKCPDGEHSLQHEQPNLWTRDHLARLLVTIAEAKVIRIAQRFDP